MTDYLHRVVDQSGEDEQERLEFDLNRFMLHERHTHLGELFEYYKSLMRDGGRLPLASQFAPALKLSGPVIDMSAWVDTTFDSAENFVMRDHPSMTGGAYGAELSGKRLVDFPVPIHADALIAEYDRCRRLARPMYHEIDQIIGGVSRAYRRLMLPLVNERGMVVRVAYTYRVMRDVAFVGTRASTGRRRRPEQVAP